MMDSASPVVVTTASRSPVLPTYVTRAEGSIPCPISIKYRQFHIELDDYEVGFTYQDYNMTYTISPIQGSATIVKVRDAWAVPRTPQGTPATPPAGPLHTSLVSEEHPPRAPPRLGLSIRIPHPELAMSPATPSPVSSNDADYDIVKEFEECIDEFLQAASNSLNNRTWLTNTMVTEILMWLPDYIRNG